MPERPLQIIYEWHCRDHMALHQLIRGREFTLDAAITEAMMEQAKRDACEYYAAAAIADEDMERYLFPGWHRT